VIIVDTSVWIDHFHHSSIQLISFLEEGEVMTHPFIIGEIASGNLRNRSEVIGLFQALPHAASADNVEVLQFIEGQNLYGIGLGYIDLHLLASCKLEGCRFWTRDKRLKNAATNLDIQSLS
jgi:predicted nucleic acid-binding protein